MKWYSPFWTPFPFPVHVTFLKPMKSFVSGILERQGEPTAFTAGGQGVWGAPRADVRAMFLGDLPPFLRLLQTVGQEHCTLTEADKVGLPYGVRNGEMSSE